MTKRKQPGPQIKNAKQIYHFVNKNVTPVEFIRTLNLILAFRENITCIPPLNTALCLINTHNTQCTFHPHTASFFKKFQNQVCRFNVCSNRMKM